MADSDERKQPESCYYCKGKKHVTCPSCEGEGTLEDAESLELKEDEVSDFQDLKKSQGWKRLVHSLRHSQNVLRRSCARKELPYRTTVEYRGVVEFIDRLIVMPGRLKESVDAEIEVALQKETRLLELEEAMREENE